MAQRPFLKWAGGKRWLAEHELFSLPQFDGRYIEPFLGGGAVFFGLCPTRAVLSDINARLIETYTSLKSDWEIVWRNLCRHQRKHCREYYYEERSREYTGMYARAAQFIYLNRACWNGLYRENLMGKFNVPIGTKNNIIMDTDDFKSISISLLNAEIICQDFEETILDAKKGDLIFADPPYTTAHNYNGFIKYNQKIFSWEDQIRLRDCALNARKRGAHVVITNADHPSVRELYDGRAEYFPVGRASVISGKNVGRQATTEAIFFL